MTADLEIKTKASKFRRDNGLGDIHPINIKSLLLQLKVLTVFTPLDSENLSGIAIKVENLKVMLINSRRSLGHQNFTIMHEIYHLCVQGNFTYMMCNPNYSTREGGNERLANRFASYILLPEDGILGLIPQKELGKNKISLSTLFDIEQFFMSSRKALLYRLKDLDLVDSDYIKSHSENIIKNARSFGYDVNLYRMDEKEYVIGDYGKLAKKLFDREIISEPHYTSLMNDIGVDI